MPAEDNAVDAWFERQVQTVATVRDSFEVATGCLESAERQLTDLRRREETARSDLDRIRRDLNERGADLDADEERFQTVQAEIAEVTRSGDPEKERINLSSRVDGLETRHREAIAAEAAARHELAAKQQAVKERERAAEEADREAVARLEQLRRREENHARELNRIRSEMRERGADLDADEDRLRTVQAEVAEVTRSGDPEKERINLSSRVDGLETRHREAMAAEATARRELAAKQQAVKERERGRRGSRSGSGGAARAAGSTCRPGSLR